jgi:retron-type reverse transcriptase
MTINLREEIQASLGITTEQLNRLILRSPYSYKIYDIAKRSGGVRTIAQPAKETKFIQHWLIENIFQKLPIHKSATAYAPGSSILINATAHKDHSYLTKFDFKNFFPSIRFEDLAAHFSKNMGDRLSESDIQDITRISCIKIKNQSKLCLSIGAPSSPILSNSIMFDFDLMVFEWCQKHGIRYTRYADDLAFSTNEKGLCSQIEPTIRNILKELNYPSLQLNTKKTTHVSRKYQRRITGLIINNEGEVSLGRDRKREISALIHRFSLKILGEEDVYHLQGLLGFAMNIEPIFLHRMRAKYSPTLINEILQVRKK